ncbi:claspin-like [Belonocnema kinseyi]|uniref:claspin-like n=1 Tax=Belonocnema kinseyi TaxID=2817044 RepID=UPI00143DFEBA|nr:claspin-like [Belonocnema kinseyi]XP_033213566.1 claspin-like [Belonocnema kinseyi]
MSFKSENVIYKNIVMEGSDENELDETVMDEEAEVDQNINVIKKEISEHLNLPNSSYGDKSDNEDDFRRNSESVFVGVKQEWSAESEVPSKSMESFDSEDERTEFYIEKGSEIEEEEEEETIAMFVTASGQQLALYAVEDSDDYFAVAVYDESGEPPTNFQFLMKSDVERLIREGAVRTVKKPTQIKKHLVTAQPPILTHTEEITGDVIARAESQIESINRRQAENRKAKITPNYAKQVNEGFSAPKIISLEDSEHEEELVEQSTVQYILCDGDQSDAELTFDDIQATFQRTKAADQKSPISKPPVKKLPERKITNNGLVYITSPPIRNTSYRGAYYPSKALKAEEQSPSLQPPVKRSHISNTSIIGSKQNHGIKRELSPASDHFTPNTSANLSGSLSITNSQSKVKRSRKQQLTSVNREDSEIIIQPASMLQDEDEEPTPRKKGKRRKKTAVHEKSLKAARKSKRRRSRVEIIDIDAEEDDSDETSQEKEILEITLDENKEKGSSDKENEVIMVGDSDDEEAESSQAIFMKCKHCSKNFKLRRAFDSHVKLCAKLRSKSRRLSSRRTRADSDSEEDEEDDEDKSSKKITERKTSMDSSKGQSSKESSKEKNSKGNNSKEKKSTKTKKQFPCKTCDEKFDMVVSLARHVRAEHSAKKRGRPSKSETEKTAKAKMQMHVEVTRGVNKKTQEKKAVDPKPKEKTTPRREEKSEKDVPEKEEMPGEKQLPQEEKLADEEEASKAAKVSEAKAVMPSSKKKLIPSLNRKWRPTELTCFNCSRWFSSAIAFEIHSLQHVTKKSAKRVYRCRICKQLFKSQFLFSKHKRMHAKAKKNLASEKNETSEKTQSEEKAESTVSANRGRGRPRKLISKI